MSKTEKFILEMTYDNERINIHGILQRIINSATIGNGIREIVNEVKIYKDKEVMN